MIQPGPTSGSGRRRTLKVTLPADPGLYRLVGTLHDAEGAAYDAATQALLPVLIVHVTGHLWVTYSAPHQATVPAGGALSLAVRVANTGSQDWSPRPLEGVVDPEPAQADPLAHLVGRWLPLDDGLSTSPPPDALAASTPMIGVVPGSSAVVTIDVLGPPVPGPYFLVIDVVTADGRSLAAAGVPPALVRVVVGPPPPVTWPPPGL